MASWLSHGGDRLTFSKGRMARKFKLAFPSRDVRATSSHMRIPQKRPRN
jgi:hypothetical protein